MNKRMAKQPTSIPALLWSQLNFQISIRCKEHIFIKAWTSRNSFCYCHLVDDPQRGAAHLASLPSCFHEECFLMFHIAMAIHYLKVTKFFVSKESNLLISINQLKKIKLVSVKCELLFPSKILNSRSIWTLKIISCAIKVALITFV